MVEEKPQIEVHCSHDEMVDVDALVRHPRNPNTHPVDQIRLLAKIILNQGWRSPITVSNRSGFIIKGHGRLDAAEMLKLDKVPVDRQDYENEAVEWADMVADNRLSELSEMDRPLLKDLLEEMDTGDFDMELTGFDDDAIEDLMTQFHTGEVEEDDFNAEPPKEPITKPGDVYQLGPHRLMCGDSTVITDVERLMDGKKADMVFTDPPYGVNYQSNMRTKSKQFETLANDDSINADFIPVVEIVSSGWVLICTTWKVIRGWLDATASLGDLKNIIVWDKGGGGIGDLKHSLLTDYELILAYNRGAEIPGKRIGSVWSLNKDNPNDYQHATQKPVALSALAMQTFTKARWVVLDLFLGSGTTLIAADQLDRICYGMEIDPGYCDVIIKRYAKHKGLPEEWRPELVSE